MRMQNSLWQDLLKALPSLRSRVYFKSTLTALSHAMEDLALMSQDQPLVLASFQQERYYRQEARRYQRIAQRTEHVYVLAASESDFGRVTNYPAIALDPEDGLAQEWHLIIVGHHYSACLVCREHATPLDATLDSARQFRGIWTFDRQVTLESARLLLSKILDYRPDLAEQVQRSQSYFGLDPQTKDAQTVSPLPEIDARLFGDRLVTYLQASQYKQLKDYKKMAVQEHKERLLNSITTVIRNSVHPEEIFSITVQELEKVFHSSRCLLYRNDAETKRPIQVPNDPAEDPHLRSEQEWAIAEHSLFQPLLAQGRTLSIADVRQDLSLQQQPALMSELKHWHINACLLVPICCQQIHLGTLELHHPEAKIWQEPEVSLVEAIAAQVGIAILQAQAYENLAALNQQLIDLERAQSNLIAIVGHELRTPLSTIQICLESLFTEPNLPLEIQQAMLQTALDDSERMRLLAQDFITLSRLESGFMNWQFEPISISECLQVVLTRISSRVKPTPKVMLDVLSDLPLVLADGEGVITVLWKLLDNACKFTNADGLITIQVEIQVEPPNFLAISITDTGRGIEAEQLETIFERFYQTEGYLQRSVGGTGLGLAICRRMVQKWGGTLQAQSAGTMQGSQFQFTVPIFLA
jgi:DICT domain-containing protein/signal transduction histidine kinase